MMVNLLLCRGLFYHSKTCLTKVYRGLLQTLYDNFLELFVVKEVKVL